MLITVRTHSGSHRMCCVSVADIHAAIGIGVGVGAGIVMIAVIIVVVVIIIRKGCPKRSVMLQSSHTISRP